MIYPHLDMDELKDFVKYWEGKDVDETGIPVQDRFKSIDLMIENINSIGEAIPWKRIERCLIIYRQNAELFTEDSIQVINKLLGDTKIRSKIKLVTDGSFLNNRIWCSVHEGEISLFPYISYKINPNTKSMSCSKEIDWMYNHFNVIYLQIPLLETREDIEDHIAFMDDLQSLDYEDFGSYYD